MRQANIIKNEMSIYVHLVFYYIHLAKPKARKSERFSSLAYEELLSNTYKFLLAR